MEFLYPNVFYGMLIPLVLLFVLLITSKSTIEKYFSKEILEKLKVNKKCMSKKNRNIIYFFVLIFFIISLARPVMNKKEHEVKQNLIPIVIALDVSKSMLVEDIFPNRIEMAKKKLQKIIEQSMNSTIGIVLFAKDSFILSPVTEDFISLKYIVDNIDTNLNFVNGSNIFSILEATKYMLEDFKVKNLVILSDGGNEDDYEEELSFAKENDIVIYSIGIATQEGAPIPNKNGFVTDSNGNIVTLKLNESIKKLSLKSGGGYIDFSLDNTDVTSIINRINQQSKKEELNVQKIKTYTELFYYPLALALFLLLLALSSFPKVFIRKKENRLQSVLFVFFIAYQVSNPMQTYAFTFNFENIEKAEQAYKNKEYSKASQNYREVNPNSEVFYNLGNSLYKEKKYDDAIKAYSKVVTENKGLEAQKLYNIGNSYVQVNKLEKAKEFYEKSLKIKEDKDTKENLELVNKELEKQKKQEEKQNNKNKEDKNKQQDNNQQKNKDQENQNQDKQQQKQEDKTNKKQNSEQKQSQEQNEQENKQTQDKKKQEEQNKIEQKESEQQSAELKKDEISDMEEKKWMKMLQNQKTPIYIQKVNTNKESKYNEKQPW